VAGYGQALIVFFDSNSGEVEKAQRLKSEQEQENDFINDIVSHPQRNLVITGHDDGGIIVFDFQSDKVIARIKKAHELPISRLAFNMSGMNLITGCHDGSINVWRLGDVLNGVKRSSLTVEKVHKTKFDEGVLALAVHPSMPFIASGGADSITKIFELFA
jgi:striatin 1/3/4